MINFRALAVCWCQISRVPHIHCCYCWVLGMTAQWHTGWLAGWCDGGCAHTSRAALVGVAFQRYETSPTPKRGSDVVAKWCAVSSTITAMHTPRTKSLAPVALANYSLPLTFGTCIYSTRVCCKTRAPSRTHCRFYSRPIYICAPREIWFKRNAGRLHLMQPLHAHKHRNTHGDQCKVITYYTHRHTYTHSSHMWDLEMIMIEHIQAWLMGF